MKMAMISSRDVRRRHATIAIEARLAAYQRALVEIASRPEFGSVLEREIAEVKKQSGERATEVTFPRAVALARLVTAHRAKLALDSGAPTIANVSQQSVQPGGVVDIYGEGLSGHVFLDLPRQRVIELSLQETQSAAGPSGTTLVYVRAQVDRDVSGLAAADASVYIVGDAGKTNAWPIRFEPTVAFWYATYDTELRSSFGMPGVQNGIAAEGRRLADARQSVEVTILVKGPGHAELTEPMAGGQDLAQGYHVRNAWFDDTRVRLFYLVSAPRGFPPPPVPGLSSWSDASDGVPWVPFF